MTSALLTEWSRLLLGTRARAGVEHVVLSPGSRSTPFAWAALNEPGLRCHSVWDERVAAFFALGQARVTGRPSLLVCTSGSAAANYYPAVIEASLAHVPLLVLTADRPFELQHAAAPQAIDQIKLFGGAVRAYFELGTPESAPSALSGVVRSVSHAALAARFPEPGPVHLNARARKPLEPVASNDRDSLSLRESVDRLLLAGPTRTSGGHFQGDVTRLARACAQTARGVIMVGPQPAHEQGAALALARLAEITGFPLLCEATSQLRFGAEWPPGALCIDGFEWLLRSERRRARLSPDLCLSFGATPTSGGYERWLNAGFQGQRFVIAEHGLPDPHGLASELVSCSAADAAERTTELLKRTGIEHAAEREAFRRDWTLANRQAWAAVAEELARPAEPLAEARAIRSVLDHLPVPCLLMLGNSLPIREVDAYVPRSGQRVRVLSQRGANGIDGLISGAAGAASVSREATVLLLGDVSFMHDLGGLAVAREAQGPFCVVVIDNGGGRIFEQLPLFSQLQAQPEAKRFWLTPPEVTLEHAALLFGYGYTRVRRNDEIPEALRQATAGRGVSLVHIVVAGESAREAETRVRARLEALAEPSA